MCYSFKTSIFSYLLGMGAALFAFSTRQMVLGSLILVYAQMQLAEAMMWYAIDNNKPEWNIRGNIYGKYILAIHNLAIGIGILLSIKYISKRPFIFSDFLPLIVGILFFLFIYFYYYASEDYSKQSFPLNMNCTGLPSDRCQNPENRIKWSFPHTWYWMSFVISIIIMWIYIKPFISKIFIAFTFGLLFLVAFLIYPRTIGSVWCWISSFVAPLIVFINYLLIRHLSNNQILV